VWRGVLSQKPANVAAPKIYIPIAKIKKIIIILKRLLLSSFRDETAIRERLLSALGGSVVSCGAQPPLRSGPGRGRRPPE